MMVPLRKAPPKAWIPAFIALLLGAIFLAVALAGSGADAQGSVPVVSEPAPAGTLRSLRDVTGSTASRKPFEPEIAADYFAPRVGSADPAIRAASVAATGPTLLGSFDGIDSSHGSGIPPDPVGAVGKTQYVQAVNGSVSVYDKTTHAVLLGPIVLNALWTGYACTNAGCACSTQNDGDPIVLYDKAADRWFIAQFSLPHLGTNAGPSFECVAVSKTGDATGAYWLYDFPYSAWVNDQVKVAVWPDGYYASMNLFNSGGGIGTNYCVYERPAMLAGMPARQYCALKPITSPAIPADLDGATPPPDGSPGYFLGLDASTTQLDLWMLHVDWATIG